MPGLAHGHLFEEIPGSALRSARESYLRSTYSAFTPASAMICFQVAISWR